MSQNTAAELRARLKESRKHFAVEDRQHASLLIRSRLYTWLALTRDHCESNHKPVPNVIAAFWPLNDEPDLIPLLGQVTQAGFTVVLPRMVSPDEPLQFYRWQEGTKLVAGSFGVMEPEVSDPILPDVVLVPTLGFTTQGDRLGYGKGFYDRTLAHFKSIGHWPTTIGVAWAAGDIHAIEPNYRPQPHDQRLDAVVTPEAWYPSTPRPQSFKPKTG
jgi:5-formyltetrahydrofolate cyclo-ligase